MLGSSQASRLNRQNTCTSYYDFLTCERECLESLDCKKKQLDDPIITDEKRIPPPTLNKLIKYFDVDDKAIEWYKDTRRPITKPCPKKFCFKFRPPVRHMANRLAGSAYPFYNCRRISPEFLCILQNYHEKIAMRSPIYQLPRKLLTAKPSLSYYKFNADAKNRHMRPGIDTAAPIEFPCKNVSCPRRGLTPEQIEKLDKKDCCCCPKQKVPLDLEPEVAPFCHHLIAPPDKYNKSALLDPRDKGEHGVDLFLKQNSCLAELNAEKADELRYRVHGIFDANYDFRKDRELSSDNPPKPLHRLYDTNPEATQIKVKDSRQNLHQIFVPSRNELPKKPEPKKIVSPAPDMNDYCPRLKPKIKLGPCEKLICPKRGAKKKDPRAVEYENRPFYKVLQASDQNRRCPCRSRSKHGSRSTSLATTEDDDAWEMRNWTKSFDKEMKQEQADNECYGYRVRPGDPPHSFYEAVAGCPQRLLVRRSQRPDLYDQNDVEMPPKRKADKCGYGFTGFIHHSEKQKIKEECHIATKDSCKRKKPPPYCYYWSAVDPDIRYEERTRLAEIDCQNRDICKTKQPHTYYWSKVTPNARSEAKKCLSQSRRSIVERQKRRAPLFWSKESRLHNTDPSADTKKKPTSRHSSITSQSSRRSTIDSENLPPSQHSKPPTFKGNHKTLHDSYYLWSVRKQKEAQAKKKARQVKDDDSSSECACSEVELKPLDTELRSSYLSTPRTKCNSTESQQKRKGKPTLDRRVYNSDRESDNELEHSIQPKQKQRINKDSDREVTSVGTRGLGPGVGVFKKPRILPNLQAVVKHFLWSSKKSQKYKDNLSDNEAPKKSSNCLKTHKDDTGPCVRISESNHSDMEEKDNLGQLTEKDEKNLRYEQPKSLGFARIQKQLSEQRKQRAESSTSQCRQLRGPRNPDLWSRRKEKRQRSESAKVTFPRQRESARESKTVVASAKRSTEMRKRSVTPMSRDTEPETCKNYRSVRRRKVRRTTYPTVVPADTADDEEPHRESFSYRNRRIQYRNYTGPEPKLNTRYGYPRAASRNRSPCYIRSASPQAKRKRSASPKRRKRCSLPKPSSHTSLASDGYHSPTYPENQYPCLAAHQKESRAQREWEEQQYKKKTKAGKEKKKESPKKRKCSSTNHLIDERSNDWFLTSRAAEPQTRKCRRSLVFTQRSGHFPSDSGYWHMVEPTEKDLKQRRKRKDFHMVRPSNVDIEAYNEMNRKCGQRPDLIYVKRAEETLSDGDEDEESNESCDCADHSQVPQLYDYAIECPNPQMKEQDSRQRKKRKRRQQTDDDQNDDTDYGYCKRCSSKSGRIRGGVDHYQKERGLLKPHNFAISMQAPCHKTDNRKRMHNHPVHANQNTNWAHSFCF